MITKIKILIDKGVLKSQQRFKCERHDVYTEKVNKIALNSNDDERLKITSEYRITSYPYGASVGKTEPLSKVIIK